MSSLTPLLLGAGLVLGGCLEPEDPIATQAEPFFYASGTPVYLRINPSHLSIETDQTPESLVLAAFAPLQLQADSISPYYLITNHWLVWLYPGTSADQAGAAALALRETPGIAFASPSYQFGTDACELTLLNRLSVKFRPDASEQAIIALNARIGTTTRPEASLGGDHRLRYPVGSRHTPLEIAAYYDRHPLVEWADPDKAGCISLNHR